MSTALLFTSDVENRFRSEDMPHMIKHGVSVYLTSSQQSLAVGSHRPCSFAGGAALSFSVMCLFIYEVQASYSQPDGDVFFIETFTA